MQSKRKKRTRIRAAKVTAGHGHKKKNRGAGHRGGRGKSGAQRGDAKLMKITGGNRSLGTGFRSHNKTVNSINTKKLQSLLPKLVREGKIKQNKDIYEIDLTKLGYDKIISKGPIKFKLFINVKSASQNVILKIESIGGKIILPEIKNKELKQTEDVVENIEENK